MRVDDQAQPECVSGFEPVPRGFSGAISRVRGRAHECSAEVGPRHFETETGVVSSTRQDVTEADRFAPALRKLDECRGLRPNWDSYDAYPITGQSIRAAEHLIRELRAHVESPQVPSTVVPLAHGGVHLEWRGPGGDLEVEISPEGEFGTLLIEVKGEERVYTEQDGLRVGELIQLVKQITGEASAPATLADLSTEERELLRDLLRGAIRSGFKLPRDLITAARLHLRSGAQVDRQTARRILLATQADREGALALAAAVWGGLP